MTEDLYDQSCDRHGIDRHMFIHEAGHAVAALDNGIPFRAVIVYADGDGPTLSGELQEAGAMVATGPDASAWVESIMSSRLSSEQGETAPTTVVVDAASF